MMFLHGILLCNQTDSFQYAAIYDGEMMLLSLPINAGIRQKRYCDWQFDPAIVLRVGDLSCRAVEGVTAEFRTSLVSDSLVSDPLNV